MKNKKIIIVLVLLVLLGASLLFLFLKKNQSTAPESDNKIKVVVSIFPLFDMARTIGAGNAEVSQLLPPGMESHSFEPKPSDILKIHEADIFVYTGEFMEPWVADILKTLPADGPIVVNASKGVSLIESGHNHEHGDEHEEGDSDEHVFDPHIWLDFSNAGIMNDNIVQAFISTDASNSELYLQRGTEYKNTLNSWDEKYRQTLSSCRHREIIYGGHYAFGYLAARYNLHYEAAQGFSPDAEPSAKDIIALSEQLKSDGMNYIFYEEISSPKIAETIAAESGAQLLLLNAAHNLPKDDFESGTSFFDILNTNLENLKTGLDCK